MTTEARYFERQAMPGIIFSNDEDGAVLFNDCTTRKGRGRKCHCEPMCAICGNRKHKAVHGPCFGQPAGSKPWGHKFVPLQSAAKGENDG